MAVTTTLDALTAKTVTVTVIRTVIVEVFKNVVTLVTRDSLIGTNPSIVARRALRVLPPAFAFTAGMGLTTNVSIGVRKWSKFEESISYLMFVCCISSLRWCGDCQQGELQTGTIFGMSAPTMSWTSTAGVSGGSSTATVPPFADAQWRTQHKGLTQCQQTDGPYAVNARMLGGFHHLGGDVFGNTDILEKTIPNLPQGDYTLTFSYYHLDNWQGEKRLPTNSKRYLWLRRALVAGTTTGGSADGSQKIFVATKVIGIMRGLTKPKVTVNFTHNQNGPLVLRFGSTLNNGSNAASWGIDDIRLIYNADNKTISHDTFPDYLAGGLEKPPCGGIPTLSRGAIFPLALAPKRQSPWSCPRGIARQITPTSLLSIVGMAKAGI